MILYDINIERTLEKGIDIKTPWWKTAIIYEIMPKSFFDSNNDGWGDLDGIIKKIDYLEYLGVNGIWITPITKSGGVDNGYDAIDYKNVEESYGGNEALKRFIKECKKKNIKVILDMVMSHTSNMHSWFIESRKNKNNEYRDWYIWSKEPTPKNYSIYESKPWKYDPNTGEYYFHLFSTAMPDLNYNNPKVRKYFEELMKHYLDLGVDGFRFDVVEILAKEIEKGIIVDGPNLEKYIKDLNKNVWNSNSEIMTVGEGYEVDASKAKKLCPTNYSGLSMIFWLKQIMTQDLEYQVHKDLSIFQPKKFIPEKLKQIIYNWQITTHETSWNAIFVNNHDTGRSISRWGSKEHWEQSAKTIASTFYTLKGTPFIYQGEEIGMTNVEEWTDISHFPCVQAVGKYYEFVCEKKIISNNDYNKGYLKYNARDHAKSPMQWDSTKNAGFTKKNDSWLPVNKNYKSINVASQIKNSNSILNHYKKLIELRNKNFVTKEIFLYGKFKINKSQKNIFDFSIIWQDYKIRTVANWTNKNILDDCFNNKILLNSNQANRTTTIGPWESRVYLIKKENYEKK